MRAVIAAMALVFAVGVVIPTEVDARAPREVEKWGCTFVAKGVGSMASSLPPGPYSWGGLASIGCPGERQQLVISMSVFQVVPGAPDRLVGRDATVGWFGGRNTGSLIQGDVGMCIPGGARPSSPYYMRMKVMRQGQPGAAWLASANVANPCGRRAGPES